jgi:hypothetical protein
MKNNYLENKKTNPPKRKVHILTESFTSKNNLMTSGKNKKKKELDENAMKKNIESLKERMERTKKKSQKKFI